MKNFKLNIENSQFLKKMNYIIIASGMATIILGVSNFNAKSDCTIEENHAHLYTNDEGFIRYINDEHLKLNGFKYQDTYIKLTEEENDLYTFLKKKKLISIEDNLDLILAIQESNQDYLEYEYTYKKRVTRSTGKSSYRTWRTRTDWTPNPDNVENEIAGRWKDLSFTGNTRLVHYVYQTYNVIINDKGKYELIDGPVVDDIRECLEEYPYIKEKFYTTIYLDPKTINYEESSIKRQLVNS